MASAFTVDLESHVPGGSRRHDGRDAADLRRLVDQLLAMLARNGARSTWFVVGWLAERDPGLVRAIAAAGHEIAGHGYSHVALPALSADALADDVARCFHVLAEITGRSPRGFRAPFLRLGREPTSILSVLADAGFQYDSSVRPVPWRLNLNGGQITRILLAEPRSIVEVPITGWPRYGPGLPIGGGWTLALSPTALVRHVLRNRAGRTGVVVYTHPWELYGARALRPRSMRPAVDGTLSALLEAIPFTTIADLLGPEQPA